MIEHPLHEERIVQRPTPHRPCNMCFEATVRAIWLRSRALAKGELECRFVKLVCPCLRSAYGLRSPGSAARIAVIDRHGLPCKKLYFAWSAADAKEDANIEVDGEGNEWLDSYAVASGRGGDGVKEEAESAFMGLRTL